MPAICVARQTDNLNEGEYHFQQKKKVEAKEEKEKDKKDEKNKVETMQFNSFAPILQNKISCRQFYNIQYKDEGRMLFHLERD